MLMTFHNIVVGNGLNPLSHKEHAYSIWTHPKTKKLWLRDLLPQKIPSARILLFAYNARITFKASEGVIVDHATSLLDRLRRK